MNLSWVTLAVFDLLPAAEISRGRLLTEGVSCRLVDRSLSGMGIVADGIELQVPQSQLAQAQQVLAEDFSGELEQEP